jgi:hypothetical protein
MTDPTAESTPGADATPPADDLRFPKFDEPTTVDPFSLSDSTPDFSAPNDLWDLPKPADEPTTTSYPGLNYQAQAAYAQPTPQAQPAPQPSQPAAPQYPNPTEYAQPTSYPQAPYGQASGYSQPSGQSGYPEPSGYPGYGQALTPQEQPYGYGYPMAPDHPSSTVVLVLGLIGMFLFPVTAPFAWVMGSKARAEMKAYPGRWGSSGTLTVGWVLGIITSVIWLLMIGFVMLAIVGMASFR